jgi:tRNA(Ile)-lysidine synthase
LQYVRKHDLLRAGDRVGVAVSGGADSVGLLRVLLELRPELGIVLSVIHLNHQLRGTESDADEQFVRDLAMQHDLEFFCESGNVKALATNKKMSLEAAARQLRYEFFTQLLTEHKLDKIATAHTLDDQAETVLLKLTRGAGTRGLAGIFPRVGIPDESRQGAIVRPLLGVRRRDLEAYLKKLSQGWREDSSNCDLRHTRNRFRHEILPRLEEQVNPCVRETLAEAAEIARAEEEYWAEQMQLLLAHAWQPMNLGGVLDMSFSRDLALAVRRRLVRAAGESLDLQLDFNHVEEILTLHDEGEQTSLPQRWEALLRKGKLEFRRNSESSSDYNIALNVPGTLRVEEAGVVIEAKLVETNDGGNSEQLLVSEYASRGLVVRNWRAGDRFWPAHTKAPKKIKELLQDRHITGEEKKRWPVVACGDEVVWMRGFGVRRDFQAKDAAGVLIRDLPLDNGRSEKSEGRSKNRR